MKRSLFLLLMLLIAAVSAVSQPLDGVKLCIDPGHGGHDPANDRFVVETGFWESEGNYSKALHLKSILEGLGATVLITRDGNQNSDDLPLSQRAAIANSNDVDYFHSIHSNAFNGESNYSLLLFNGETGNPTFDDAKAMGRIMVDHLKAAHRTTGAYNRGDRSFLGFNLGVLRTLSMPGTLSEGSFHDYIPESFRLLNNRYRRHEAWAITRSFLDYFEETPLTTGIVAGIARDPVRPWPYYHIPGTGDQYHPVNGLTVTVTPGNHVVTGDVHNNGFFMVDSLDPGSYTVLFEANGYVSDSVTVEVNANQSVFADKLIYSIENAYPPAIAPQHVRLLWGVKNTLQVQCDSVWNATGYVAYLSNDGETFTDSVISAEPDFMIPRRPSENVTYVKVRAFNEFGYSPITRDLYAAIPSSYRHEVLLVDGFDRSTNTRHDYMRFYAEPLLNRGIAFSSTLNETIYEDKLSLEAFDTVIWILGDESSADDTFNPAEQERVKTFLRNGGRLLVSGAEIGWDLEGKSGHPSAADKAFYHEFLKARYVNDAPLGRKGTYYRVDGLLSTFAEGLTDIRYDNGSQGTINVDWPDAVEPLDGAHAVFRFQSVSVNNGVAGLAYAGLFPDGTKEGKLVYLTFPFETVFPQSSREILMDRIFDFFEGTVSVSDPAEDSMVQQFALNPVYPNPFNARTTISYTLPPGSHTVQVSVYDITGRRVRTLMSGRQSGGAYRLVWDGTGFQGHQVSSGVYTVRIQTDQWRDVSQMTLIK